MSGPELGPTAGEALDRRREPFVAPGLGTTFALFKRSYDFDATRVPTGGWKCAGVGRLPLRRLPE